MTILWTVTDKRYGDILLESWDRYTATEYASTHDAWCSYSSNIPVNAVNTVSVISNNQQMQDYHNVLRQSLIVDKAPRMRGRSFRKDV